mgnify:CR=1 FL=1
MTSRICLAGWIVWSLGEYVARQVVQEPARLARGRCAAALSTQANHAHW